jgi:hypothetical protein
MRIKAIIMLSSMLLAGMMVTIPELGGDKNRAELEAIVDNYSECALWKNHQQQKPGIKINDSGLLLSSIIALYCGLARNRNNWVPAAISILAGMKFQIRGGLHSGQTH